MKWKKKNILKTEWVGDSVNPVRSAVLPCWVPNTLYGNSLHIEMWLIKSIKMTRLSWTTGPSQIPSPSFTDTFQREAGRTLRINSRAPEVSVEAEVGKVFSVARNVDGYPTTRKRKLIESFERSQRKNNPVDILI